ncbi:MAG: hypothetical protein HN737_02755 [Desulfobacterales bacterium]|jgi:hypothetical protein|nr:hypothetical protein [Desulfobacteraceae bacterium]MBT4363819.1 hypothetical protein [Desulfobacteraceae bacterium]MBT7696312.1 hypothetical protein [Desulfobacterales bacterium]
MDVIKYILGVFLILFGVYIIAANYACIIINKRNKKKGIDKHHSFSPVFGPLLFIIGLSFVELSITFWVIIVFLVDPGTWLILLGLPYALFKGFFSGEK